MIAEHVGAAALPAPSFLLTRRRRTAALRDTRPRGAAMFAAFLVVQIADGVLTFSGVARFGLAMESNPLLATAIATLGAAATLSIAKTIAVLLAVVLHGWRCHATLALLTLFYAVVAVLPWAAVLI